MLLNTRTCNLMDDIVLSCLDAFILDGTAPINMVPQNIRECNGDCLTHVKVKVTPVQALRLCTDRTAHRGSRGIALPFLDHGTRRGWGVSVTPLPFFNPGRDPVPIVQEAGWAPGPVWAGKISCPTGIQSPDRPARSQSLYRLSYPAHCWLTRGVHIRPFRDSFM